MPGRSAAAASQIPGQESSLWAGVRARAQTSLVALLLAALLLAPSAHAASFGDSWWDEGTDAPAAIAVSAADAVSTERAYAHVRALAGDVGSRPADSPAFRSAVDYARDHFERLGYRVTVQDFTYRAFEDLGSTLRLDAEGQTIKGIALWGSPSGDVTGPLVDVGLARPSDLAGLTLDGRIALAKRGEISFGAKAENARAAGAVGLVIYNSEPPALNGRLDRASAIPVLGVTGAEGRRLLGLTAAGPTAARLNVQVRDEERASANVIAEGGVPGTGGRVLVGAHLDSVPAGPGANDNGSGSASVLELARVFAGRPEGERLTFALFGAEELGLIGSQRYVAWLGDDVRRLRAMVNLDMVAVGDTFEIGGAGERSRDLARRALEAARALGYRASAFDPGGGSDHDSFARAGVPAVMIHWRDDPNYHRPGDTVDKVDPAKLTASIRTVAHLLESYQLSVLPPRA